jgi:hypothetical protein
MITACHDKNVGYGAGCLQANQWKKNDRIAQHEFCIGMDQCLFNSANSKHCLGQAHGVLEHGVTEPATARRSLAA